MAIKYIPIEEEICFRKQEVIFLTAIPICQHSFFLILKYILKLGDLYKALEKPEKAVDAYNNGNFYEKAIQVIWDILNNFFNPISFQLARLHFPERVIQLEENFALWLNGQQNYRLAATHFLGF